jgi:ribosomal protein S18 acetylase RimI-like enzyme
VSLHYRYQDGRLSSEQVDWQVPRWFTDDRPEFSVQANIEAWSPYLEQGGVMLGALDGELLVGLAMLRHRLTESMAQLEVLHASRDYGRRGIAAALLQGASRLATEAGAREMYISATPSGSAVGFYRSQGFELAEQVNQGLYELEPEDIHMVQRL